MSEIDPALVRIAEASERLRDAVIAMVECWMAEGHSMKEACSNTRATVSLTLNDDYLCQPKVKE